jgi:hypothetical protein
MIMIQIEDVVHILQIMEKSYVTFTHSLDPPDAQVATRYSLPFLL